MTLGSPSSGAAVNNSYSDVVERFDNLFFKLRVIEVSQSQVR